MDKRHTATLFRQRLLELIARKEETVSAFARRTSVDRSALSQFLNSKTVRLPRVETLAAISASEGVSIDWLLGFSQSEQSISEITSLLNIETGKIGTKDSPLAAWHTQSVGYKIKYSPTSLPDLLRTRAVIEHEFGSSTQSNSDVKLGQSLNQLRHSREPETEIEAVIPKQRLINLAQGTDVWTNLSKEARKEQIAHMIKLIEELYPTFRLFIYDGQSHYCAPFTIFGPVRAAIYIGEMYLIMNSVDHIREISHLFDNTIRVSEVGPDRCADWLRALKVV